MKTYYYLFITAIILCSCSTMNSQSTPSVETEEKVSTAALTPKVTGIGGIFFKSEDPKAVRAWYGENLGMTMDDYGSPFEFRNANRPEEKNYLNWNAFEEDTDYFDPSTKEFMINYRVQNIEGLVEKLKKNGVTIVDEIVAYPYGKFVHILDLEGNSIELWEPIDSVLTDYGRATTK